MSGGAGHCEELLESSGCIAAVGAGYDTGNFSQAELPFTLLCWRRRPSGLERRVFGSPLAAARRRI